jgi:carboxypeptidase family protein
MSIRALGLLLIGLLVCRPAIGAETTPQTQGALVPGPAAPRPQTPATPARDPNGSQNGQVPKGTGVIRGRVTAADSGNPLRRAQVRLGGTNVRMAQAANTDGDGRYEFSNLPAGRYNLTVTKSGYVTLEFGQQRPFEPGKPLDLADGQQIDKIDFTLPRGSVIAGRITDEFGEPVPGVQVQAMRYQYMPDGQRRLVSGSTGPRFGGLVTDDLGQFRVYGLMPGAYVLSANATMMGIMTVTSTGASGVVTSSTTSAIGGAPDPNANDGYATTYYPGTANVEEAQTITLGLAQETSAYFSLVSTRLSRISGFVRNSEGRPAQGMMVSLRTASGGSSMNQGIGPVAADGSFSAANIPPGEHFIDVRPMGGPMMGRLAGATAQTADDEFASVPITVAGQDITGLIITTGPGATISGRLIFDGTSPRPMNLPQPLRVNATPAEQGSPMMFGPMSMDNGVVDDQGRFQLKNVNGRVLFRSGAPGGWNLKLVTLNGVDITDTPFEAKPSATVTDLEVMLTDRATNLSGSVKNSRGEIVKDYVLAIFPNNLREGAVPTRFIRTVRPDQDGHYKTSGLPAGDYFATAVESLDQGGQFDPAFREQLKARATTFSLMDGQTLALDLQLVQ